MPKKRRGRRGINYYLFNHAVAARRRAGEGTLLAIARGYDIIGPNPTMKGDSTMAKDKDKGKEKSNKPKLSIKDKKKKKKEKLDKKNAVV
mgnify:CR=1 FL=1